MVVTREQNETLTRFGPGTAMGELLRRYWYPVAVARELTPETPTMFIRILGEDLVLYRDRSGHIGLLGDHCSHRGASLLYGRVEERGIACAYHGWLYDAQGNCLETPAEPADSLLRVTVRHKAYPVRKFIGLYWAYLGPQPAPEIPRYDVWARSDGRRKIGIHPQLDCNWLQAMENSADVLHASILHQDTAGGRGRPIASTTRGRVDDIASWDVSVDSYGIMKRRISNSGSVDEQPLIFPNILCSSNDTQIRIPIDDTHTRIWYVYFIPGEAGDDDDPEVSYVPLFKDPVGAAHPFTRFRMDLTSVQDFMAWETQGPIADRTVERLATSDRGIELLRRLYFDNIEAVRQGRDPFGVIRDPDHAMIDTKLDAQLALQAHGR